MARKILVIEDSSDARLLYTRVLEMENYEVKEAATGEEAIQILSSDSSLPDLILVDLSMPGMGGEKFIETIKQSPAWSKIKIVIASGWDSLKSRAEQMNADGYITKPIDIDKLLGAIENCCPE